MEIPPNRKGHMTTLEGFLTSFKDDLQMGQEERRSNNPTVADQIDDFIIKLDRYINAEDDIFPFTFILDDPAGNTFIQNLNAPNPDPNLKYEKYERTIQQIKDLGYEPENVENYVNRKTNEEQSKAAKEKFEALYKSKMGTNSQVKGKEVNYTKEQTEELIQKAMEVNKRLREEKEGKVLTAHKVDFTKPLEEDKIGEDVVEFEVPCNTCQAMGYLRMCTCAIPYFKEIIIMAFTCDACGHRTTEVKTGGAISEKGRRITVHVKSDEDINRDLFKSESAQIIIPEIGCTVESGSLGGVYSTVEGVLEKMLEVLQGNNPFMGDSTNPEKKTAFQKFLVELQEYKDGKKYPFRLILDDPLSNCFVQNPNFPKEDSGVEIRDYERSAEQNDDLGITYLLEEEKKKKREEEKNRKEEKNEDQK